MFALIHQPAPNPMQSGTAGTEKWVIEFPNPTTRRVDPLTGTHSGQDMNQQLDLHFDSKDAAIAFARSKSIPFQVKDRKPRQRIGRAYGDNFAYDRKFPWTH